MSKKQNSPFALAASSVALAQLRIVSTTEQEFVIWILWEKTGKKETTRGTYFLFQIQKEITSALASRSAESKSCWG